MAKANIAVMVSGGGTNLQALIDAQNSGILHSGQISLVISNIPDAYALERAKNAGIPAFGIHKKAMGQAAFEQEAHRLFREYEIDLVIFAGFLSIVTEDFIRAYTGRIINIHPSLLPSFGGEGFYGLRVHEAALQRGVKLTGATVHFVNETVDGGEIIAQKAVEVLPGDTPEILQKRVMEQAEWVLLPQVAEKLSRQFTK
ncbi:MAG: phosphoribosylglycinamide formyltransferase [Ruminococcaceae bacterium]|nr:phosphoribosylglycinamide formyltransferase [Oscillospiraceae bacterium]